VALRCRISIRASWILHSPTSVPSGTNPSTSYEYDIKIDHNFSSNDKISGRFSRRQNDQDQPTAFGRTAGGPAPGTLGPGFSHTGTPSRAQLRARLLSLHENNLNLGWFQVYPSAPSGIGVISEADLGITGMPNANEKVGMPYFNFVNYHALGATTDTLFLELQASNSLTDVFSVIRGKHNIRVGGEARHLRIDNLQPGARPPPGTSTTCYRSTGVCQHRIRLCELPARLPQ